MSSNENTSSSQSNPIVISEKIIKDFAKYRVNIGKLIRKGKYGAVYEGIFGNDFNAEEFYSGFKCESMLKKRRPEVGQKFSLKFVNVPLRQQLGVEDVSDAVIRETTALMAAKDIGIVVLFFAVKLSDVNQWFIFMELADGDLRTLLLNKRKAKQSLCYELSKTWIQKLTKSLKNLHQNGISHGRIRSSNILIFVSSKDRNLIDVKIGDFVSSHVITEQQMKNQTPEEKQLMEDHMDEDLIDIYFLFTEILNLTQFKSEDQKTTALDSIKTLITSGPNSVQLLDTLLKSKYLS